MNKFQLKLQKFFRKRVVGLKRNYYTLPFILICAASFFFLCCLFIISKSVERCAHKYTAVYLFMAVLTSILSIVAIVSYTKKVYGQKRPLKMLIIYFIIVAFCISFIITVLYFNEMQIITETKKRDALNPSIIEWYTFQTYINYGVCSRTLLIIFLVLETLANISLIAGPAFEKLLQKVHFDNNDTPKQ